MSLLTLNTLSKATGENLTYTVDFTSALTDAERVNTIQDIWISLRDRSRVTNGISLSGATVISGGLGINFWIASGLYNYTYCLHALVTTTSGQTLQWCGLLNIEK